MAQEVDYIDLSPGFIKEPKQREDCSTVVSILLKLEINMSFELSFLLTAKDSYKLLEHRPDLSLPIHFFQ